MSKKGTVNFKFLILYFLNLSLWIKAIKAQYFYHYTLRINETSKKFLQKNGFFFKNLDIDPLFKNLNTKEITLT